jgi:hypothetical protein
MQVLSLGSGLFDNQIHEIHFVFSEPDYYQILSDNKELDDSLGTSTFIPATGDHRWNGAG